MTSDSNTTIPTTLDDATFTPEQQERLLALRARLHDLPDLGEFGLDLRRLEFARWLVVHDYLHERCDSPADEPHGMSDLRSDGCQARCA